MILRHGEGIVPKKDMFGITRLKYERNGPGWWVRLNFVDMVPTVQRTFCNSEYGGVKKALKAALRFRDEERYKLEQQGVHLSPTKVRPILRKSNETGISGVELVIQHRWANSETYYAWRVTWAERLKGKKKGRAKHFGFNAWGGSCEAYAEAAYFRHEIEKKLYGYSIIEPDRIGEYYDNHAVKLVDGIEGRL